MTTTRTIDTDQEIDDVTLPPVIELTEAESYELFDRQARAWMGMSGEEFARRLRDGEIEDVDRNPVIKLSLMMPAELR